MIKDPNCGMEVNEKKTKFNAVKDGKKYYFCSPMCQWAFEENPGQFLRGKKKMRM